MAAKNSVVAKMAYAPRFSAFGYHPIGRNSLSVVVVRGKEAIADFVRSREFLRLEAHENADEREVAGDDKWKTAMGERPIGRRNESAVTPVGAARRRFHWEKMDWAAQCAEAGNPSAGMVEVP